MSVPSSARRWCFTLCNYDAAELDRISTLCKSEKVRCAVVAKEIGKEGTPHLQCYISFSKVHRFKAVKAMVGERAHVEACEGTEQHNLDYCKKGNQSKEEYKTQGTAGPNYGIGSDFECFGKASTSGKRSDIDAFKEDVKAGEFNIKVLRENHSTVFARCKGFCIDYIKDNIPLPPPVESYPLRPWQQEVYSYLIKPPIPREICFVVDGEGNGGKSWFAEYFAQLHEHVQIMKPGKFADMAYQLDPIIRVFILDCPRSKQGDFIQYDFLECLKDGRIASNKYESRMMRYPLMHVVVFMNEYPDRDKLSDDRFKEIIVSEPKPKPIPSEGEFIDYCRSGKIFN